MPPPKSKKRERGPSVTKIDEEVPACVTRFKDVSRIYKITFFLLPFAAFIESVGICMPYWLDVKIVNFDVIKMEYHEGLWERCNTKGCEIRKEADIEDYEMATRAFSILAMFCALSSSVLIFLSICIPFTAEKTIIHVMNMISCFTSCGLALLALFVFAGETKPNRARYLSYGYYFTLLGAVLIGVCGLFVLIEIASKLRTKKSMSGFHPRLPPEFIADDVYKDREKEFREDSEKQREPYNSDDEYLPPVPNRMYYDEKSSHEMIRGSHHSLGANTDV